MKHRHHSSRIKALRVLNRESYNRLAPAKEHQKQVTPNLNPNDRHPAQLTDQAPGNIERAAQEPSRITPTSTATSSYHHADPAGTLPECSQPTQPSAQRRRAEAHYNTDTTRTCGDTRGLLRQP